MNAYFSRFNESIFNAIHSAASFNCFWSNYYVSCLFSLKNFSSQLIASRTDCRMTNDLEFFTFMCFIWFDLQKQQRDNINKDYIKSCNVEKKIDEGLKTLRAFFLHHLWIKNFNNNLLKYVCRIFFSVSSDANVFIKSIVFVFLRKMLCS